MKNKENRFTQWPMVIGGISALAVGGAGGYFIGFDRGQNHVPLPPAPPVFESSLAEDLPAPEDMEAEMKKLEAQIAELQLKADNIQKPQVEVDMETVGEVDLAMLQGRIDAMPAPEDLAGAQFLADPRANEPTTPSGVSTQVLDNYQRDTGISPQEVEELMQKER